VGLERGPLSLISTTEKLLERKSSSSGLENREYGSRDTSADHATHSIRKKKKKKEKKKRKKRKEKKKSASGYV
jgi:hypothetical protein